MSFREKIEDDKRTSINQIRKFIHNFGNLPKHDQWFIGLTVCIGISFLILGGLIFAGFLGPLDKVVNHHPVTEKNIEDVRFENIKYSMDVVYSGRGAIAVNCPINVGIEGRCTVSKSILDPPKFFNISFYPRNARTPDNEYCVISTTATRTVDHDTYVEYSFKANGEAKFHTSGNSSLSLNFLGHSETIGDVFEIKDESTTLQISQLRIAMYVLLVSLIMVYISLISLFNMIRGIYKDRSNTIRGRRRDITKLRREIYRDRNRPK